MKTIATAMFIVALSAGAALAEKPELPASKQGSLEDKERCLTQAGFVSAATPADYATGKNAGKPVFYISDSGRTTVPKMHEAAALKACADVLGDKN